MSENFLEAQKWNKILGLHLCCRDYLGAEQILMGDFAEEMLALGRRCSWLGFKPFPNAWGVAVWVKVKDEVTVVKRLNSCALTKALLNFIQLKAEV